LKKSYNIYSYLPTELQYWFCPERSHKHKNLTKGASQMALLISWTLS